MRTLGAVGLEVPLLVAEVAGVRRSSTVCGKGDIVGIIVDRGRGRDVCGSVGLLACLLVEQSADNMLDCEGVRRSSIEVDDNGLVGSGETH
jgi:hypothetical protein